MSSDDLSLGGLGVWHRVFVCSQDGCERESKDERVKGSKGQKQELERSCFCFFWRGGAWYSVLGTWYLVLGTGAHNNLLIIIKKVLWAPVPSSFPSLYPTDLLNVVDSPA
jgi:hypothetical protein